MTLEELEAAPGNTVVYSEKAWAVARKGSSGGPLAYWFPDHGSSAIDAYSAANLLNWADDWSLMTVADQKDN